MSLGIDSKVTAVVSDNVTTNDSLTEKLSGLLKNVEVRRVRCICHTLQLVMRGACSEGSVKKFIKKVRKHVRFLKIPTISRLLRDMPGNQGLVPIGDVETRWSSVAMMICRLVVLEEVFRISIYNES
jgi:hypothetical protein